MAYLGHTYAVRFGAAARAELGGEEYANRNGVYRSLVLEADGDGTGDTAGQVRNFSYDALSRLLYVQLPEYNNKFLHFAYDDNRYKAVYYGAKLPRV